MAAKGVQNLHALFPNQLFAQQQKAGMAQKQILVGLVFEIFQGFRHRIPHCREIVNRSLPPFTASSPAGTDDHDRHRNLHGHLHPGRVVVDRHGKDGGALLDLFPIPTAGQKPQRQDPHEKLTQSGTHPHAPPFFPVSGR